MKRLIYSLLVAFLGFIFCNQSYAQSDLKWVLTPQAELYPQETTRISSYFVNPKGEIVHPQNVSYETKEGNLVSLEEGRLLQFTPIQKDIITLIAKIDGKFAGEARIKIHNSPEIVLANEYGNTIDDLSAVIRPEILQLLVSDRNADQYSIEQVLVTQFRGGKSVTQKAFTKHILDFRNFQIEPGDGFMIKIEKITLKDDKTQAVKMAFQFLSFAIAGAN